MHRKLKRGVRGAIGEYRSCKDYERTQRRVAEGGPGRL